MYPARMRIKKWSQNLEYICLEILHFFWLDRAKESPYSTVESTGIFY